MSKRGLSWEEKKTKMLEIFHENSEFFTIKELEKIAPKSKGIVWQSVKEVVEELISESKVTMEKIGTSNYCWSFPSATGAMKTAAVEKAQAELALINSKLGEAEAESAAADKGREDTPERRKLLQALQAAREEAASLQAELAAFGAADPVKYEKKRQAIEVCKEAAQRWTDNTLVLVSYVRSLGMMEVSEIYGFLGINDEWEDLPQ